MESNRSMPAPPVIPAAVESAPFSDELSKEEIPMQRHPDGSVKVMPNPSKQGVDVVANRPGYFKGSRKVEGDKFTIKDMSELGDWMTCLDKQARAKHEEIMKARREVQPAGD